MFYIDVPSALLVWLVFAYVVAVVVVAVCTYRELEHLQPVVSGFFSIVLGLLWPLVVPAVIAHDYAERRRRNRRWSGR